ncbi:rhomboid family intramembrane serine protease [Alkalicoccus halolimnae]|uniref:Rhomboid family intramembrane serine protease n=1 Tax=Alkalicoccus halolimnae TaxID=1667239 RepID=A0A5C7FLX5_9BACI|nr:rhomboid family intramembrane serine protease [Alkalicoccus halolimnae]TXF86396.1 rhomboid family intramembrane serine protease [Alkalicoccus halolimnae]
MEYLAAEVRFWETVYHLINEEKFQIVHLNEEGPVVWLEDTREKNGSLLRLQLKSYDWSKQLRVDIKRVHESAKTVRKKLKLKHANVTNVIFAPLPPVDSYEDDVSKPLPFTAGGKKQMRTILIPMKELQEKLFPLATEWKLHEMPSYTPDNQMEEEEHQTHIKNVLRNSVRRTYEKKNEEERSIFMYGKPTLTFTLISAVFIVFLMMELQGSSMSTRTLINMGAKFDPLILDGEWWRFFSAMFLHIGFFHLFMNSLALFFLGNAVERIFGSYRFIFIYFTAGFFGSVASFVFNDNISAGASGAIFGLFGALLYFGLRNRRLFFRTFGMNVVVILVINLAFGFLVPMVDNGAHIGGLVGGFAASAMVSLPGRSSFKIQTGALLAAAAVGVVLVFAGYTQDPESPQLQAVYYELGREAVEDEDMADAISYFENVLEMNVEEGPIPEETLRSNTYFLLAYAHLSMDGYEEAEGYLREALVIRPDFHEAYYNLALIAYERENFNEAQELVERALELENNSDYEDLREEILDKTPEG